MCGTASSDKILLVGILLFAGGSGGIGIGDPLAEPDVMISLYGSAECPCFSQALSDIRNILRQPAFSRVDMEMHFTPKCLDGFDLCDPSSTTDYLSCIHGKRECVAHRYFLCAMAASEPKDRLDVDGFISRELQQFPPTFRSSSTWLDFQACCYGECQLCNVFEQMLCVKPCKNIGTFANWQENDIMKICAATAGLNWETLKDCAAVGSEIGDRLQVASSISSRGSDAIYGTKGLPVLAVATTDFVELPAFVQTQQKIPYFCGATPLELLRDVCAALGMKAPPECSSEAQLCGMILNASRLQSCRDILETVPKAHSSFGDGGTAAASFDARL